MKSIHIRDIDEQTLERLKHLARNHHRSLQGELRAILSRAAEMAPPDTQGDKLNIVTVHGAGTSTWSREDIYGNQGR